MRIAFVVHDYHREGGQSRYVAELASRYAARHEVHVFANQIKRDDNGAIYHHVPAIRGSSLSTVLSFALPSTWMTGGFDIVHAQGFCCWGANVITTHMCSRAWDLAYRRLYGKISAYHALFNRVAGWLEWQIYNTRRPARVIAISQLVADDIRKHYSCRLPTQVLHHGVDLDAFSPGTHRAAGVRLRVLHNIPPEAFVFFFAGDLRKGAKQCIQALVEVPGAHLLLVSRSSPRSYSEVAETMGLSGRVHLAGPTDHIEEYYAAADAFLLPSPYDTFGMVVLEAMASGIPVIVSPTTGAAELVEEGINGFVLSAGFRVNEIAARMAECADNPEVAHRMGAAARVTAERHSWDTVAEQTLAVYRSLLAS